MKTRVNPITGREEYWNKPEGLPGIWMKRGFCQRCQPLNKCMGFLELSNDEWKIIEDFIEESNSLSEVEKFVEFKKLEKCIG